MADKASAAKAERKRTWNIVGGGRKGSTDAHSVISPLPSPIPEGRESTSFASSSRSTTPTALSFRRTGSSGSLASLTPLSPKLRSNSSGSLTKFDRAPPQDPHAHALARTTSAQPATASAVSPYLKASEPRASGSFSSRISLSSMMASLTRSGDEEKRGRPEKKDKDKAQGGRAASFAGADRDRDTSHSRTRSQSPFRLRARGRRDASPAVEALSQSDAESDAEGARGGGFRPRNAFSLGAPSEDESGPDSDDDGEGESEGEESWDEGEPQFDSVTERNTERNALVPPEAQALAEAEADVPEYLGEGVNVIMPPEPYFPSTLNATPGAPGGRGPKRRKNTRTGEQMPLQTSRPVFQRDRCTITITQGDPAHVREEQGRAARKYVLASDLSDESRYALEWGIGTVLRDGDELFIVTVVENENKVDPQIPNPADRATKLRSQQERQALAYILVRQATGLLQRTKLNVTISCQAWHAKNSRHMILDIVDYYEPTMLIVGSRGLGHLKGILLGSTSHYLIQKCSVPVMVARRRLKRPPRRSAHLSTHRARVSLAQAGIDRVAARVDQDVANMRNEIEREDEQRENHTDAEHDDEVEAIESPLGIKVAGD